MCRSARPVSLDAAFYSTRVSCLGFEVASTGIKIASVYWNARTTTTLILDGFPLFGPIYQAILDHVYDVLHIIYYLHKVLAVVGIFLYNTIALPS